MSEIFQQNLFFLRRFDPAAADLLAALPPTSAKEDVPPRGGSYRALTKKKGLVTLFIYGISPRAEEYLSLREWLKGNQERAVVFLVDDHAVAKKLLESSIAAEMLTDPQVLIKVFSWPELNRWNTFRDEFLTFYKQVSMNHFALAPKFAATQEELSRLNQLYTHIQEYMDCHQRLYREAVKGRTKFADSYYLNLLELPNAKFGQAMAGAFKNIPAIICGAGPSINQHLDKLKTLTDRAIIFGSGTGMNVLSRNGIIPHFGCGYDPTPTQLSRVSTSFAFQTPYFYTNSFNHEALNLLQGDKIAIREGANPFADDWFDRQLGIPIASKVSSGATTSNHCFDIACFLGCNPIILVGIDLCYSDNTVRYAEGVTAHPAGEVRHHADIKSMKPDLVKAKGLDGSDVTTAKHWLLEANCFMDSRRAYPEIAVWNATEGGMPIREIPNIPLQEVMDSHLQRSFDFESLIHNMTQRHGMDFIDRDKLQGPLIAWRSSLEHCHTILTRHLGDLHHKYKNLLHSTNELPATHFEVDLKTLLAGNIAYDYCLRLVNDTFEELNEKALFRMAHFPERFPPMAALKAKGDIEIRRCIYLLSSLRAHLANVEDAIQKLPTYPMLPRSTSHQQKKVLVETEAGQHPQEETRRFYYATGELYAIKRYRSKLLHGTQNYYFIDGSERTELNYSNGILSGAVRLYYPSGLMKRELHFYEGKLDGMDRFWRPDGSLSNEAEFRANRPVGRARSWHPNGMLARETTYHEGAGKQAVTEWNIHGRETTKISF